MGVSQVIKYEGSNSVFIWKHPLEDFNSSTQLIVHSSQEAIFFMNGQALDLFGAGRFTLETQNIPLIQKILNKPTGDQTPFHCEVYFINKTEQMAIKWGTDSKVHFIEPTYKFPLSVGASGEMSLRAENSRKLLLKIVGTEKELNQESLVRFFRAFLMTRVKTYLAQTIREENMNIFEIDEKLTALSDVLKAKLKIDFEDYGVSLEQFFVTNVARPEGDAIYEKFKDLYYRLYAEITEAELKQKVGVIDQTTQKKKLVIEAEGIAQKRNIEGYSYQQERAFDVAQEAAGNEGAGNFSAAGIGLGVMSGVGNSVGGAIGTTISEAVKPMKEPPTNVPPVQPTPSAFGVCPKCNYKFEKATKFCPECGTKQEEK